MLAVSVPTADAEIAADILWAAGAQAIEELQVGDRTELRTELGKDPLSVWSHAIATTIGPEPSSWTSSTRSVERSVADTWKKFAQVTAVGSVRIVPSWNADERRRDEILIDPGGAFGMGDHPTTRATLSLALALAERGEASSSVLDLGCGSGVLGITLAVKFGSRIVAVDIAPAAIEATSINASLNGVLDRFIIERGDVNGVKGSYELVLANILAPVLLADRDTILRKVAARGSLILSGFTETRLNDIVESYESVGCLQRNLCEIDGWYGLELQCP